jgi:hypothetical protein
MIAKRYVNSEKSELNAAALAIQQCYRSWYARRRHGRFLHERELEYRMDTIQVLTSEEEWTVEQLSRMAKRMAKSVLKADVDHAANKMYDSLEEIYALENNFMEQKRQREILSPRAVQQGWVKELESSTIQLRDELTRRKLDTIFNQTFTVCVLEDELEKTVEKILDVSKQRERIVLWKEQEYSERRNRFYQRDLADSAKNKRLAIADERRKWTVRWCTKDGKPDKKRRPGKKWDSSVFAGIDKMTYSGGTGVDLLAFSGGPGKELMVMKRGSEESVQHVLNQVPFIL